MKIVLSLLILLLLSLTVGCASLDDPKNDTFSDENKESAEHQLSKSIDIKRSKLMLEDFSKHMNDEGFIISGKQDEKVEMISSKDGNKAIHILKNIYHNNDYIYFDLIFDSASLNEQGEIELQYDVKNVYSVARINSENLSQIRNAIGYSSYQITDSGKDAWIGFLFKKRTSNMEIEIPLSIDLNQDYSAYIILTLPPY